MAIYTSNYAWAMPEGSDPVDITVLNNNLASQDNIVHNAYMQFAPVFSTASTYAVDDVVLYANNLYKCITAVTVAGDWDATKWIQVKVSDIVGGGGGGGTSDYTQLTNKPSINSVTLSGNKTSADLGLQDVIQLSIMPSAGATYAGKIVQFVGTTDATYTHGYYYECANNGGAYTWTQLNVQPSSGGGTSDYTDLTNKPQINGVTLTGNKSTSDLGINAAGVGLGNVPNVATDDQTPTFTTAQSRNNLVSGEKLSIMLGKISKFFNDLKTVAFTGSFSDLSNKPENANTFQGTIAEWNQLTTAEKKAYDHASIPDSLDGNVTFPASKVMLNNGDSVEDRVDANAVSSATRVDISSYDDSTPYVCTVDGYVELAANASGRQGTVKVNGAALLSNVSGTQLLCSIYVKKGMSLSCSVSGGAVVFFYPLS